MSSQGSTEEVPEMSIRKEAEKYRQQRIVMLSSDKRAEATASMAFNER